MSAEVCAVIEAVAVAVARPAEDAGVSAGTVAVVGVGTSSGSGAVRALRMPAGSWVPTISVSAPT